MCPKFLERIVLVWTIDKSGTNWLKIGTNWPKLRRIGFDKLDLERIDLYLVNLFQLKFVPTSLYHFFSQFAPTYVNSYQHFQTFDILF